MDIWISLQHSSNRFIIFIRRHEARCGKISVKKAYCFAKRLKEKGGDFGREFE